MSGVRFELKNHLIFITKQGVIQLFFKLKFIKKNY